MSGVAVSKAQADKVSAHKVAIACQGGGTHAAFTWGVLTEILRTQRKWELSHAPGNQFQIVGFSGTSAGALCALAAWYGLTPNTADTDCGTPEKAVERLDFMWHEFAAKTQAEIWHNWAVQTGLGWKTAGLPSMPVSPTSPMTALSLEGLKKLGVRPEYLGFDALLEAVCPDFDTIDWPALAAAPRRIMVGAMEVLSGNFEIFDSLRTLEVKGLCEVPDPDTEQKNRWRMRRPLSLAGVAASGTLPEVQPARRIPHTEFPTANGGPLTRDALYWDGLYSQNPPVRELLDVNAPKEQKPDEIWVIRINPQEVSAAMTEPEEIEDRRNELAGNVSLNQELDHIQTVNRWLLKNERLETMEPFDKMKKVTVRTIKMLPETAYGLRYASKLDRDLHYLETLADEGRRVAATWLERWRKEGGEFPEYPDDARYDPQEAAALAAGMPGRQSPSLDNPLPDRLQPKAAGRAQVRA